MTPPLCFGGESWPPEEQMGYKKRRVEVVKNSVAGRELRTLEPFLDVETEAR